MHPVRTVFLPMSVLRHGLFYCDIDFALKCRIRFIYFDEVIFNELDVLVSAQVLYCILLYFNVLQVLGP